MNADVLGAIADLCLLVALVMVTNRLLKLEKRIDERERRREP